MPVTAVSHLKDGIIHGGRCLVARHKSAALHSKIRHYGIYESERGDFQRKLQPSILRQWNHQIRLRRGPDDPVGRLV